MKKSIFKRITVLLLTLSMLFATNAVLVLADSLNENTTEANQTTEVVAIDEIAEEDIEDEEIDFIADEAVIANQNEDLDEIENDDSAYVVDTEGNSIDDIVEDDNDVFGVTKDYSLSLNFLDNTEVKKEDVKKIVISKGAKNIQSDLSFEIDKNKKGLKGYFDKTRGLLTINANNEDDNIVVNEGYQLFYDYPNVEEITGLSNLDTHSCKSMAYMFALDKKLTKVDFENLDISSLTETISMFEKCESLKEIDLSNFHNDKKIQMDLMFLNTGFETVDLSGVQLFSTYYMFGNCKNLREVSLKDTDTTNWEYTSLMFSGCDELNKVDMTGCDFSKLLDCFYFGALFDENSRRVMTKVIEEINVSNCTFAKDSSEFFAGTVSFAQLNPFDGQGTLIKEYKGVRYKKIICNNAKGLENASLMFANNDELIYLDLSDWDISNLSNAKDMLSNLDNLNKIIICEELSKKVLDLGINGTWINVDTNEKFDFSRETPNQTGNATYEKHNGEVENNEPVDHEIDYYWIINDKNEYIVNADDIKKITILKTDDKDFAGYEEHDLNDKGLKLYFNKNTGHAIIKAKEKDNIILTEDCSMFCGFHNVEIIEGLENLESSKTEDMNGMFEECKKLTQVDFEDLNTDSIKNARYMFRNCKSLEHINLKNFNKNLNEVNMEGAFLHSGLKDIELYGLENVKNMEDMLYGCEQLEKIDFSHLETTNVENISYIIYTSYNIKELNLSNFDFTKVKEGEFLVGDKVMENGVIKSRNTSAIPKIILNNIKFSKKEDLDPLLSYNDVMEKTIEIEFNNNVLPADIENFFNAPNLQKISLDNVDVSNVTKSSDFIMSHNLNTITLGEEISKIVKELHIGGYWKNVNTNKIYDIAIDDLEQTGTITYTITTKDGDIVGEDLKYTIENSILDNTNIDKLDVKILTFEKKFEDNNNNFTKYNIADKGIEVFFDDNKKQLIISCKDDEDMKLKSINTFFTMFKNVEEIKGLGNIDTSKEISMVYSFSNLTKLKKLDFENLNTDMLSYTDYMFVNCVSLEEINLSNFNKNHRPIQMLQMFDNTGLKKVDLYGLENCTKIDALFVDCKKLEEVDFSHTDTKNIVKSHAIFGFCENLKTIKLNGCDLSNLYDIRQFFTDESNLQYVDLSNAKLPSNCSKLFKDLPITKVVLTNVDASNVTDISEMFSGCSSLTELDLSSFKPTKAKTAKDIFKGLTNIEKITLSEDMSKKLASSGIHKYWKNVSNNEVVDILSNKFKQVGTAQYIKLNEKEYIAYIKGEQQETIKETTKEESIEETTKEETTEETTTIEPTTVMPTTIAPQETTMVKKSYSSRGGSGGGGGGGGGSATPKNENLKIVAQNAQTNVNNETKVQKSLATTPVNNNTANSTWTKDATGNWNLEVVNANGQKEKATNTWASINNEFNVNGHVVSVTDFYYFDDKGKMLTGWLTDNTGVKYYLDTDEKNLGKMYRGWKQIGNDFYYLGLDGKLVTNATTQDGHKVDGQGKRIQ